MDFPNYPPHDTSLKRLRRLAMGTGNKLRYMFLDPARYQMRCHTAFQCVTPGEDTNNAKRLTICAILVIVTMARFLSEPMMERKSVEFERSLIGVVK